MKRKAETGQHHGALEGMHARSEISAHWDQGELRVDLMGTFDASSAERLIECLQDHQRHIKKAVIETRRLSYVDPVGKSVFRGRLHELKDLCYYLVFYGKHAHEISPSWTFSY